MAIFTVWIAFTISQQQQKKLESHKKVCENKDFYNVIMPFEDTKILECNPCQNCDKAPSVI